MPRLSLGLGLNLIPRILGGGIPFPSSGNVGYYNSWDITKLGFSSANNVNLVSDQSTASNDLTQGTATQNPTLIEFDPVTHTKGFKNRLAFGADDNLNGLEPQSGDFSYMIKLSFNTLSSTEYILTDSAGDSALVLLADNYLYLRDTGGSNDISLDNHSVVAGEHVYVITREGNTIKYYVDSILKQTVDVTGRTYTFNRFGSDADSMQGSIDDWGVWNRALTQEEVDYFSYLRNEDTNAILQPPLTPAP